MQRAWKSLNQDQKWFVGTKRVEGSKTIEEWLLFFKPLADFDEKRDLTEQKLIKGSALAAGGGGLIIDVLGEADTFPALGVMSFVLVGLGVLVLSLNWQKRRASRKSLHKNLSRFFVPFLNSLKDYKGQAAFKLDFRDRRFDEEALDAWTKTGLDYGDFRFDHPWMSGCLPLAAGASVELEARDHLMVQVTTQYEKDGLTFTGDKPMLSRRMEREIIMTGVFPRRAYTPANGACKVELQGDCYLHEVRKTLFYKSLEEVVPVAPVREMFTEVLAGVCRENDAVDENHRVLLPTTD